jgi:hypothetical protein
MNQWPDSGTTHCGFGLSCHSPTQPTGRTVKNTATTSPGICRIHIGAACPPTLFISNPSSAQFARPLVPFGALHRL